MPRKPVSRRSFMAVAGATPAVAAATRQPVVAAPVQIVTAQRQQQPLRIATMYPFSPAEVEQIRAAAPAAGVEIGICESPGKFREKLTDAEAVYGAVDAEDLRQAARLKWIQWDGAGIEGMDPALRSSAVVVTNYQRTFAPAISETAIGMLLCLTRGITTYYMPQFHKRRMKPVGTPQSAHHTELAGRTMGIVGMGGIGTAIARRAHYGFDMIVVGTDAKPLPRPDFVAELHDPEWFPKMVPQADVLVAAAPHTSRTERMFHEDVFRNMKRSAFFLAMSRGKLYDDMALVRALREGWIAGAGLDVFPVEPPPSEHPIFDCPNVVMTAHTSGWSPDRQVRLIALFAENVRRYTEGLPLMHVVDKQRGY